MTTKVLSGERPERPKDPILTDGLWNLTQRCLDQNPQRRPVISELVGYLQRDSVIRNGHVDDTALGSTQQREPLFRVSSFVVPSLEVPLTGLKGTRCSTPARRPWRRCKSNKISFGSRPASVRAHGIKSKGSGDSLYRIKSGQSNKSTSSGSRGLLRKAALWLFTCGAPAMQDHHDHPDSSFEKQGTRGAGEDISGSNHCHARRCVPGPQWCLSYLKSYQFFHTLQTFPDAVYDGVATIFILNPLIHFSVSKFFPSRTPNKGAVQRKETCARS